MRNELTRIGYQLSPAYDIVNSRLVLPGEQEEVCLSLQGKKNRLSGGDFFWFAEHFGLTRKQADNSLGRLHDLKSTIEAMIVDSFLSTDLKEGFLKIFRERMDRLFS